ncbi:MAG: hypothetical protein CMB80_05250 [Flammeovirgaceae bacterium]|nr:hypothetical protein [Flammeovirgaceae bacterium]|tara:strand:+ start:1767 stop:3062 length:1296 start_codon:yes stop_codon:yes gene_type:complete
MAVFKAINPVDVKASKSSLNQLIDVVQADVSGSTTRKKMLVFVTGGVGPGVTSSLFQTVYDQDYTLQTANPIFDMTFGLYWSGSVVTGSQTGEDANGKLLFPSSSLMMREKINIYKQFAQLLLGNATSRFYSPVGSTTEAARIDNALFLSFKRLFTRDSIKRETVALKVFTTAAMVIDAGNAGSTSDGDRNAWSPFTNTSVLGTNVNSTSTGSSMIITDIGSSQNQQKTVYGGDVGRLVDSNDTTESIGLCYYDEGVIILNINKIISGSQFVSGVIDAMSTAQTIEADSISAGKTVIGTPGGENPKARFVPDFLVSASMDNIIDHFAGCRFQSGSALTMGTFQNMTQINSTLIFCRAAADEFNYSSNPTFIDSKNNIVVIDANDKTSRAFSMPTTIGLYDASDTLLAVAKLSRPIEKNDQKDITWRVRLDF